MLARLIELSIEHRFLVIVITLLVAAGGIYSAVNLPIDAVPDMTNIQVQVLSDAGALSPIEVEKYVSFPIETTMSGLPRVEQIRSVSKFGLSVVTIVFEEGTDIQWARQLVGQRLPNAVAKIPPGAATPELGPMATALGEILQFEVRGKGWTPMDLRTLLEWDIAPRLREVRGVTEVNAHGGFYKSYEVRPDPDRLASEKLSFEDVFRAIQGNNETAGGGYVVHNGEQRLIRGLALLRDIADVESIVVRREADGTPLLIRDIASVTIAPLTRQGAATRDGRGEAVIGLVMMTYGENSRRVVSRAKERLDEIRATLPPGVSVEILYDRASLIGRTLNTVLTNLCEGGLFVVAVLLLTLGSFRAGILVTLAIPLSMLFATNLMSATAVTASLMSLGAIDFGLIVDSSVIMVENCVRRLSHAPGGRTRMEIIRDAAVEVRKPTMFGELIIGVVYLPILALSGTEGKLFKPMALTVLFALAGSLILSLTFIPAVATLMLPRKIKEGNVWLIEQVKRVYEPVLKRALAHPLLTAGAALLIFGVSIPVALNLGGDFMPKLAEGDLLIEAYRLPTATLEDSLAMTARIEKELLTFPEVRTVFCKTGRPEIASEMMGVNETDIWIILKPKHEWPAPKPLATLSSEMAERLESEFVGVVFEETQPIEMRVNELVAGVKADVAVFIYGDDLNVLNQKAKEIEAILHQIRGSADVKSSFQANLSTLRIEPNREALARYGIDAARVMDVVSALGGRDVGQIFDPQGRARFPIRVRIPEAWRASPSMLEQLPVAQSAGKPVPLKQLAEVSYEETPDLVEHESGHRRAYVSTMVRGRDVGSFVAEAERTIKRTVSLPPHYEIRWGGTFQNLRSATQRLAIITPIVLVVILLLLHTTFGSMRLAGLIFLAVPLAASGGVFALAARGLSFSISAGVGFIALFGVSVLNGLVWVTAAERAHQMGAELRAAALETALVRLRPILMTALVASLGFLPMALSTGDGAELQRPLATVVIGGLITSTLLTSLVLPAIYPWFAPETWG
ncbi:MAG TPA: CusA/CzcA family heavy metal efflux RND transporter [Planctomycetaceae bacterium]|nr:CusA/CzcA family heavy metal efflux RND transporter [Planctomycetaceae bacterium]